LELWICCLILLLLTKTDTLRSPPRAFLCVPVPALTQHHSHPSLGTLMLYSHRRCLGHWPFRRRVCFRCRSQSGEAETRATSPPGHHARLRTETPRSRPRQPAAPDLHGLQGKQGQVRSTSARLRQVGALVDKGDAPRHPTNKTPSFLSKTATHSHHTRCARLRLTCVQQPRAQGRPVKVRTYMGGRAWGGGGLWSMTHRRGIFFLHRARPKTSGRGMSGTRGMCGRGTAGPKPLPYTHPPRTKLTHKTPAYPHSTMPGTASRRGVPWAWRIVCLLRAKSSQGGPSRTRPPRNGRRITWPSPSPTC